MCIRDSIGPGETIPPADLIILPGSKSVCADLGWLREQGWELAIHRHLRYSGKLIGICGGFQMLGKLIHDPDGLEGIAGNTQGFAFFDMETTLKPEKLLRNTQGTLTLNNTTVTGYEIHAGIATYYTHYQPSVRLTHGDDLSLIHI